MFSLVLQTFSKTIQQGGPYGRTVCSLSAVELQPRLEMHFRCIKMLDKTHF